MKKLRLFILAMLMCGNGYATTFFEIDTTQLIRCSLSSKHHNRIVVSGGRIIKAIYPEGEISIRPEDTSGQIFVESLSYLNPEPITISIVTSEGIVQDLEIMFTDIPSEVIVLKAAFENMGPNAMEVKCACDDSVSAVCLIDSILSGVVPSGYVASDEVSEKIKIKSCIMGTNTAKFVGEDEIIYVWNIENRACTTFCLKESDLNFCNSLWVYISKKRLKPKEKTLAIVSVRK